MLKKMTFKGGDAVQFGFYWNRREWEACVIPKEGGTLAGGPDVAYVRLPLLAVLVLAPVMGAVYAIFLPFIGFAMVTMYLAGLLKKTFTRTPPAAAAHPAEHQNVETEKRAA